MYYDGYSDVHLVRTWTDLLLEPYFLYWRGFVVVRIVDAQCILDLSFLDAPVVDSHSN